jgi:hypothetical protein
MIAVFTAMIAMNSSFLFRRFFELLCFRHSGKDENAWNDQRWVVSIAKLRTISLLFKKGKDRNRSVIQTKEIKLDAKYFQSKPFRISKPIKMATMVKKKMACSSSLSSFRLRDLREFPWCIVNGFRFSKDKILSKNAGHSKMKKYFSIISNIPQSGIYTTNHLFQSPVIFR